MAASLFLLAALVLAVFGGHEPWAIIATIALATAAGTRLPDLDTPLRLRHRSLLLHSMMPMLVALLDVRTWSVASGLGFGIGVHLAADLFPNRMRGFATIKVPLWGSIGPASSYAWIAANAAGSLVGGLVLLGNSGNQQVITGSIAAVSVLGVSYLMSVDGGWCALTVLTMFSWFLLR